MPFFGVPIRNGLPIGLGSVAGFGAPQEFSPSELFLGGTAGAWYDPSDLSTMFDTSAGTTPVAMPGQGAAVPVGLMLDKSQGLVLGSELVTNGDFSQGSTGWTAGAAGVTIIGGAVLYISVSSTFTLRQSGVITAEKTYEVQYEITAYTGGTIQAKLNGTVSALGLNRSATGVYKEYITSTSTADGILAFAVSGFTGTIDNISVRELPGNHAIAFNNTTARPELRARVNLLTYSEEFDNGTAWNLAALNAFGSGSVANTTATFDPLGGNTADFIQENTAASTTHGVNRAVTLTAGAAQVITCSFKAATRNICILGIDSAGGNGARAYFDLSSTGSVGTSAALGTGTLVSTPTITSLGNGWFRCQLVAKVDPAATSATLRLSMTPADNTATYTGDGTSGIYIWGADLRPANIGANVPAYQRIADANTYDTSGFPLYLRFDGIDDSMYTPANLNLSGTDKVAVFAGVRQTAAGSQQQLVEFSADVNANNGAFSMPKDAVGAAVWTIGLRGTSSTSASSPANYAAPITTVNAGLCDIGLSTDEAKLRINGVQVATSGAGSAGTGNFGTYPLFIGARNNSSLWFNGHLYSLAVVGSAVSAGNIAAMENWVAGKTGIQI